MTGIPHQVCCQSQSSECMVCCEFYWDPTHYHQQNMHLLELLFKTIHTCPIFQLLLSGCNSSAKLPREFRRAGTPWTPERRVAVLPGTEVRVQQQCSAHTSHQHCVKFLPLKAIVSQNITQVILLAKQTTCVTLTLSPRCHHLLTLISLGIKLPYDPDHMFVMKISKADASRPLKPSGLATLSSALQWPP